MRNMVLARNCGGDHQRGKIILYNTRRARLTECEKKCSVFAARAFCFAYIKFRTVLIYVYGRTCSLDSVTAHHPLKLQYHCPTRSCPYRREIYNVIHHFDSYPQCLSTTIMIIVRYQISLVLTKRTEMFTVL